MAGIVVSLQHERKQRIKHTTKIHQQQILTSPEINRDKKSEESEEEEEEERSDEIPFMSACGHGKLRRGLCQIRAN